MRRGNKRMGKSRFSGKRGDQARGGQVPPLPPQGAQPTTVPFSHPTGTNPAGTLPRGLGPSKGHSSSRTQLRGATAQVKPGKGLGAPRLCWLRLSPARLPPLSHPPQREEGAGRRRSAVGEAARRECGRLSPGSGGCGEVRSPNPPAKPPPAP